MNVFIFLTQLGDARTITVIGVSMAIVLLRHKRKAYVAGLGVAIFGSLAVSYIIKIIVQRPRPPFPLINVSGYSFPSMHAAVSMAAYGFLAYMVWKLMHPPHHRLPWVIALSILILLIGASRVYLDVHYTSDVLTGFIIGGFFVWLGIVVTKKLLKKRTQQSHAD